MEELKYEDIYIKDYENVVKLESGLTAYFRFYDEDRPHQSRVSDPRRGPSDWNSRRDKRGRTITNRGSRTVQYLGSTISMTGIDRGFSLDRRQSFFIPRFNLSISKVMFLARPHRSAVCPIAHEECVCGFPPPTPKSFEERPDFLRLYFGKDRLHAPQSPRFCSPTRDGAETSAPATGNRYFPKYD